MASEAKSTDGSLYLSCSNCQQRVPEWGLDSHSILCQPPAGDHHAAAVAVAGAPELETEAAGEAAAGSVSRPMVSAIVSGWSFSPSDKSVVLYNIEVSIEQRRHTDGQESVQVLAQWRAQRRFSQFVTLDAWLAKNAPMAERPALPSKFGQSLFSSAENLANTRLLPLRTYVLSLSCNQQLTQLFEVQDFLGFPVDAPHSHHQQQERHALAAGALVYLKVVEAERLPSVGPQTYAWLYQTQSLFVDARIDTVRSRSFPSSNAPRLFAEFLFAVDQPHRPIRVQLFNERMLADQLLGQVQVDVRTFEPRRLYDVWLPLDDGELFVSESARSKQARVRLLVHVAPMAVAHPAAHRLPDFRVQFTCTTSGAESGVYPGQTISGLVVFNVARPEQINRITLRLVGVEETSWTEGKNADASDSSSTSSSSSSSSSEKVGVVHALLKERRVFFDHPNSKQLDSGSYIWPFEFQLPVGLPPSFESPHAWIRYALRATVHRPPLVFNTRETQPLRLLAPFVSARSQAPRTYSNLDGVTAPGSRALSIQAALSSEIVAIGGGPARLSMWIENQTPVHVVKCDVCLHVVVTAKAERGKSKRVVVRHSLGHISEGLPVPSRDSRHTEFDFLLPPDIQQPSLPGDLAPHIVTHHTIEATCHLSGSGYTGPASVQIPVIVGHPVPTTADVTLPPSTLQPSLTEALRTGAGLPHFSADMHSPVDVVAPAKQQSRPASTQQPRPASMQQPRPASMAPTPTSQPVPPIATLPPPPPQPVPLMPPPPYAPAPPTAAAAGSYYGSFVGQPPPGYYPASAPPYAAQPYPTAASYLPADLPQYQTAPPPYPPAYSSGWNSSSSFAQPPSGSVYPSYPYPPPATSSSMYPPTYPHH